MPQSLADVRLPERDRPALQRARGTGRIATKLFDGKTRIDTLYQEGCAKIRLPRTHSAALEAVLINTAGGLTGGDRIDWQIDAAPDARLVLTTQACERIYKTTGAAANVRTRISVGPGAHVDWLPQETILFDKSRLDRRLDIELADGASFTGIEAILLGREAMGESARQTHFADNWRITRNSRLIHAESNRLSAEDRERDAISLLHGNIAFATIVHIAANANDRLDAVRELLRPDAHAAASAIGERLILRAMAPSGLALRRTITPIIAYLSGAGSLPRLWST